MSPIDEIGIVVKSSSKDHASHALTPLLALQALPASKHDLTILLPLPGSHAASCGRVQSCISNSDTTNRGIGLKSQRKGVYKGFVQFGPDLDAALTPTEQNNSRNDTTGYTPVNAFFCQAMKE